MTPRNPIRGAAFYCMSSAAYFLGAVGMVNSLRLAGHNEPVFLLDLGLTPRQRELLAPHVTLVDAPEGTEPWLAKTVAPLAHPAETMVLIDADLIVVRPLADLIDRAAAGRIVAIENDVDRFDERWGELLGLGELERRPYVSSGLVFCGGELGAEVIRELDERQRRVEFERTYVTGADPDYPLAYLDQDVLNAILQSRIAAGRVDVLGERESATTPFGGLELLDEGAMRCAYPDGAEPLVVHFILAPKPWQRPMYHGVYSQLLKRTLVGDGLEIELPPGEVPVRFRDGPLAGIQRTRILARDRLGWQVRRVVPDSLLARLDVRRRRGAVVRR